MIETGTSSYPDSDDAAFHLLIDYAREYAIYRLDADGLVASWNIGAERLYGYIEKDIIGKHFSVFSSLETAQDELEKARQLGFYEMEFWCKRKDGSLFLAQAAITPLRGSGQKITGYLKAVRDITLRQRMEDRFRMVVESSPNGMVMIDPTGKIEMVNTQTEEMFGYRREAILGQPIEVLLPHRFRAQHPTLRNNYFSAPSPRPMGIGHDLYGMHQDGREFPIEIGLNPIETEVGLMVLAVVVDISKRKQLEEHFRQVIQEAPNAMILINAKGEIILFNRQAENTFLYRAQEVIGRSIEILVPERYRPAHPALRGGYFSSPEARPMGLGRELYGLRQDGNEFPVEIGLTPIEANEGRMVLAAIVDITARKTSLQQIENALQEKTVLLNEIHHRVKNNLQIIISLLNMQMHTMAESDAKNALMDSQIRVRSIALIHQLLYERHDFSRVELGEYIQKFGQLLLSTFGSTLKKSELKIVTAEEPIHIELQRATPCGLLINELVTNAIKHAYPEGDGIIWVRLSKLSEKQALLIVEDNGIGMGDQPKMNTSKSLGLQLVPILADQLGGIISCHNNKPGVRYEIRIPLIEEESSP
ncbi:PAS domain-containing sensor histidine kinase [Chitinimonas sp. PSY-7]|uniref:PAS domain S-box protein n=1 Tax=Chitinimonas sp. PSY-7 TaxID=3459088 RepID=UPI004040163E